MNSTNRFGFFFNLFLILGMRFQFLFLGFNFLEQFGLIDFFVCNCSFKKILENVEKKKNGKKKNEIKKKKHFNVIFIFEKLFFNCLI